MPFRIDLDTKKNTHIYLIIINNQINFNFQSAVHKEAIQMRNQFKCLMTHFKMANQVSSVRGEDPEHIKRHHITTEEINIPHLHVGFDESVTPALLSSLFDQIMHAQKNYGIEHQFITNVIKNNVLLPFEIYYKDFINSKREIECAEERALTNSEQISLITCSRNEKRPLVESDIKLLNNSGLIKNSDRYIAGFQSQSFASNKMTFLNNSSTVKIVVEDIALSFGATDFG